MNILDSRILLKRSTTAGATPTVPTSSSHTDGTWVNTDIYEGELFLNTADARLFTRQGSNIKEIGLQNSLIGTPQFATITLTSTQILALNTTPITLVAAPGAGKAIMIKDGWARINYNSTTYSNTLVQLKINGADEPQATISYLLESTVTRYIKIDSAQPYLDTTSKKSILENAALQIYTSANPTTGNSTIDILVEYQILDFDTIF